MSRKDFSEIGHTGGKATFTIVCNENGDISYQTGYSHSSLSPMTLVGIYAHPDGFACGNIVMGGIGDPWNTPPFPNCIAVLMASDSEGKFGHECPECNKHFRSETIPAKFPLTCPYCSFRMESFHFLTPPQKLYISHYIESLITAINEVTPNTTGKVVIDMNVIADSITDKPRPDFYYTSITQQTEFNCKKCNCYNDIRGRYGYCASCGTRNTAEVLKAVLQRIRSQLVNDFLTPNDAVKQAVSEFDSAARDYVSQLILLVPMKVSIKNQLEKLLFHNLNKFDELLKRCFDINILKGMSTDHAFVNKLFFRRHVYEHDGGVATKRYSEKSGDNDVEEGELIRETIENTNKLISCLNRMITNFDTDFHEIFEPVLYCIELEKERKKLTRERNA
jgi:DNA-directed RNA polymerase subunit RPC12/RpoP